MALWQARLTVVPSIWGIIPEKTKSEYVNDYSDPWEKLQVDKMKIIDEIDSFITQESWPDSDDYYYWKGDMWNREDNDVSLCTDPKSNTIINFYFRFDLRDKSVDFICKMLELCRKNEWKVKSEQGDILDPDLNIIPKIVENSLWKEFLDDPEAFDKKVLNAPWNKELKKHWKEQEKKNKKK